MAALEFEYREGGLYLPRLRLWLDPHWPKQELVFVSHAHSDHTADHREVILSEPTARLMSARMGGKRIEHAMQFGETRVFRSEGAAEFRLTLLAAGHIFGSAMSLLECEGESLLYTGDFKLRKGLSAEPCEPRHADVLIMETTYGRPHYRFPSTADVMRGMVRFCREALDNDETAVLYGYSLGKSQEVLCSLAEAGLPIVLHGTVYNLTKVYEQFGHCFPPYEKYEAGKAHGKVVLCPPSVAGSAMLRNLGKTRCAVLTGWALDPGCQYRYRCDAAFPISDHADFPDLVEFVRRVAPKKVFTLHGFAADFAATIRGLSFEARALSEDEQMVLDIDATRVEGEIGRSAVEVPSQRHPTPRSEPGIGRSFAGFAHTCAAIAGTTSKLEKTRLLADYFTQVDGALVPLVAVWFTGLPFAASENRALQVGWALLRDALCDVTGVNEDALHHVYLKHSDLGETAHELYVEHHSAGGESLTIADVRTLFESLLIARGPSAKRPLLVQSFQRCTPIEAKFLVKIITSDLRIGLKEGLVEEAIAKAFACPPDDVRTANLLLGNIGRTAALALEGRLKDAGIEPFRAVKVMLASPEETAAGIFERLGHAQLWIEDKYDGIRCQLHKRGAQVALYSRDLKEVTDTFHDVADSARRLSSDVILDGEILAMRGEEVLPFAELQKRLGRREHDLFLRDEVPVQFVAFDLLWKDGRALLNEPLRERRRELGELTLPSGIRLTHITAANSVDEIEAAFTAARDRNNEGLIVKDPASIYSPGRRGLSWLKLKKALATLDCVVVGAEYGHGKRSKVLSDYTFAVRDEATGQLKTIGKAYTGLTDVEIAELTRHFQNRTIERHGRYHVVHPDTVLEIAFDRLQESERHASGLAMRFPRIIRIRTDKTPADADTLSTARKLAGLANGG
jgi:DNA ligase-1